MAKTKISKIAKDLNVSLPTVIEFLSKKGISIDENPNTRVEDDIVDLLMGAFKSDKDLKTRSAQITTERKENRARPAAPAEPERPTVAQKPRILGKLELDSKGNPIVRKPEEAAPVAPKAEAPKAPEEEAQEASDAQS